MVKKILRIFTVLFLAVSCLLSLFGCEKSYPVKRSSFSDTRVMAKGKGFKVRYEFVRSIFAGVKSGIDGGDDSVWTGADAQQYFDRALDEIDDAIREVYGTLLFAESIGIDTDSRTIDKQVMAYVRLEIEGGSIGGQTFPGYGSRDKYLEALAQRGTTDSVNRLMYRYSIVQSALYDLYLTTYAGGSIDYSNTAINNYYQSSDCMHFNWVRILKNGTFTDDQMRAQAEQARAALAAAGSDTEAIKQAIALYSHSSSYSDIEHGLYVSPYSYSGEFEGLVNVIRDTAPGEISQVYETYEAFYIIVGMSKEGALPTDTATLNLISDSYLEHCLYRDVAQYAAALQFTYTSRFNKLTAADLLEN